MHPTKLIYKAWKNTDSLPYETSQEKRMIELLDPVEHEKRTECNCHCYLCGEFTEYGIPKKKLLPSTFNDHDKAKEINSDYVCDACSFMILTNPNRRQAIRWFNYVASDKLVICNRKQLRDVLLNPPEPPFVICITISQKKHLLWYLKTSYSRENFFVTMETETIQVNKSLIKEMIYFVENLYNKGITKDQILNNTIPYGKLSIDEWKIAYEKIKEYKLHRQFELSIYVSQKEDEQ